MKKILYTFLTCWIYLMYNNTFAESGDVLSPLQIETHSLSYHVFSFIGDWVLFFSVNMPWFIMLFMGFATVGLLLSGFFYHKNRL